MPNVEVNVKAPEFALPDVNGHEVFLRDYVGRKHVLLVLNRGFA